MPRRLSAGRACNPQCTLEERELLALFDIALPRFTARFVIEPGDGERNGTAVIFDRLAAGEVRAVSCLGDGQLDPPVTDEFEMGDRVCGRIRPVRRPADFDTDSLPLDAEILVGAAHVAPTFATRYRSASNASGCV